MGMMTFFKWITLRDYEEAKEGAKRRAVSRFSRGNILIQNRRYLNEADAAKVVLRGDRDMAQLERACASR